MIDLAIAVAILAAAEAVPVAALAGTMFLAELGHDGRLRPVPGVLPAVVAAERRTFVVCEVKTRSGTRYGTPLDAVGQAKRRRLRRLAALWLSAHGVRFDQIRIDVVGLLRDGADGFTIEHVRGVG